MPQRLTRFLACRATMIERGQEAAHVVHHPVHLPQALADALTEARAATSDDTGEPDRAERAVYHRAEVARLSVAGTPVAQIAAALGLSYGHVVAMRAQFGVGRRR